MKVLAIADVEDRRLWDNYSPERLKDVDLILSAGDLDASYLEFLVTVSNKPLVYVRGNHDDGYGRRAPGGCICVEDSVYVWQGVRIAGLGGSAAYRFGANMYTEEEMEWRVRRLELKIRLLGGVDVLLTHAPARGVGDLDDRAHRGFECFNRLIERWRPDYLVHGHVHKEYLPDFQRTRVLECGTRVVNAYDYTTFDLAKDEYPDRGWMGALANSACLRDSMAQSGDPVW